MGVVDTTQWSDINIDIVHVVPTSQSLANRTRNQQLPWTWKHEEVRGKGDCLAAMKEEVLFSPVMMRRATKIPLLPSIQHSRRHLPTLFVPIRHQTTPTAADS